MVELEKSKPIDMKKLDDKLRQLFDKKGNKIVEKKEDKKEKLSTLSLENKIIDSVPVQSISPTLSIRGGGLDFSSSGLSNVSSGLESDLVDVNIQKTQTDDNNQQKKDEAYQNAKMLYEDSESGTNFDVGSRPMVARNSDILINEFSNIKPRSAGMINSHPEIRASMNENPIYDIQIKELRHDMPWEADTEESVVKKYKSSR